MVVRRSRAFFSPSTFSILQPASTSLTPFHSSSPRHTPSTFFNPPHLDALTLSSTLFGPLHSNSQLSSTLSTSTFLSRLHLPLLQTSSPLFNHFHFNLLHLYSTPSNPHQLFTNHLDSTRIPSTPSCFGACSHLRGAFSLWMI